MSVISNFPAMPNRINIAAEYLYGLGAKGDEWNNVEGLLSPLTQKQGEDGPEEKTGKSMAEDVLREMERLGMLTRLGVSTIALHPDLSAAASCAEGLPGAVHAFLFSALTDPARARDAGQEELPGALAWLMAQDPLASLLLTGGGHIERIDRQMEAGDELRKVIGNDQRFQNLVYWARYLGLAERVGYRNSSSTVESVIPDPTDAIARCLPVIFGEERELTIQEFVRRLAAEISVLDGGIARRTFDVRLRSEFQLTDEHLSRPLSLALWRLKLRREIILENPSDATSWSLDLGKKYDSVSHIIYVSKELP